ncbi:hypothetical protein GE061_020167 [Apolygus lucorum]|uniref:Bro-N domain-containing protein n=1 Tax=Apolygus lucorum TaxID=248454 RepID=A0A8S9WJH5_APOLU|nr:hypothetical protein GE061_020167 [Apolygus lucorum]
MPPKQTMSVKVGVKKGTLFLNESAVATVYDTRGSAWFKSNDVGAALGYTNASSSVTQKIPPEDKSAFQDISIHANSVKGDLHARNVFINQRGLIRYLRERDSSCDIIKIQNMSQSLNPSCSVDAQVPANTAVVRERVPVGRSFHNAIVIDVKGSSLMLNGTAVDTVYDYKSHAWFKCNDVAAALGFANASSSVSQHIHSNDKLSFSSISLHNDSPEESMDNLDVEAVNVDMDAFLSLNLVSLRKMLRKLMIILVAAVTMSSVYSQLTFSPGWGKRSHNQERCQPNVETFVYLYKYLEGEIQKVIDCSRSSGNQAL